MSVFIWNLAALIFIINDDISDELKNLPDKKNQKEKTIVRGAVFFFILVTIFTIVFTIIYFVTKSTVFSINAKVEKVSISPFPDHSYPDWRIQNATLHPDCGTDKTVVNGILNLKPTTYIEFLRIQHQPLTINLENDESDSVGSFITDNGDKINLDDCAAISLDANNDSQVFAIEGDIKIGGTIKETSDITPILYEGKITILDKALITREYYSVGPFDLDVGDIFVIEGHDLKSVGFVHIDSEKGIKVSYSSRGNKGYIKKYKTEDIEIKNGLWTKIYNDPSLIIIWFIGIILYAICRIIIRINLNEILDDQKHSEN